MNTLQMVMQLVVIVSVTLSFYYIIRCISWPHDHCIFNNSGNYATTY